MFTSELKILYLDKKDLNNTGGTDFLNGMELKIGHFKSYVSQEFRNAGVVIFQDESKDILIKNRY